MNYVSIPGLKYKEPITNDTRRVKIIDAVCAYYDVKFVQLQSKKRFRTVVLPRQVIMFFLRKHTKMGWLSIGQEFKRDHTTAIHACQTVKNIIETEESFRHQILEIENLIFS